MPSPGGGQRDRGRGERERERDYEREKESERETRKAREADRERMNKKSQRGGGGRRGTFNKYTGRHSPSWQWSLHPATFRGLCARWHLFQRSMANAISERLLQA